jgi:hypothetical protein
VNKIKNIVTAQKTRLLLVNNPITSLFMAAWGQQNQVNTTWRTIGVYCTFDLDISYSEHIESKKIVYQTACCEVLNEIVDEWIVCLPEHYNANRFKFFSPIQTLKERKQTKNELNKLRETFASTKLKLENVQEIWYGSSTFDAHFFYLCPQAIGISFEHGLSDVRNSLLYGKEINYEGRLRRLPPAWIKKLRKVKSIIQKYIYNLFLYFSPSDVNCDLIVSILGDEIRCGNRSNPPVTTINPNLVFTIADSTIKKDPCYQSFTELKGNNAIILLDQIKPWAKGKADHLAFFKSFFQYIGETWEPVFKKNNVDNIIVKSRFFHEEHSAEGFDLFSKLIGNYNFYFLSEFSEKNYTLEYYIPLLQPILILGNLSSGLFYTKKLMPKLMTFTYDTWFIDYCYTHFHQTFPDFKWLGELYYKTHAEAFKEVLPVMEP